MDGVAPAGAARLPGVAAPRVVALPVVVAEAVAGAAAGAPTRATPRAAQRLRRPLSLLRLRNRHQSRPARMYLPPFR